MAKFPRSNRKRFQIQKSTPPRLSNCMRVYYPWEVWGVIAENRWGILGFFETKKEARQYIINKRRAIKEREW